MKFFFFIHGKVNTTWATLWGLARYTTFINHNEKVKHLSPDPTREITKNAFFLLSICFPSPLRCVSEIWVSVSIYLPAFDEQHTAHCKDARRQWIYTRENSKLKRNFVGSLPILLLLAADSVENSVSTICTANKIKSISHISIWMQLEAI